MGTTPVAYVDQTGIHRPDLATALSYLTTGYAGIYGSDVALGSDTQDGEFLGLLGAAIDDANAMAVDAYNAYSPATAQGAGLSSNVKINGMARNVPTNSTVPVLVGGSIFVTVTGGLLVDPSGNQWLLPTFTIPAAGEITVTATCQTQGAITLASGVVMTMVNPTQGWASNVTTSAATVGAPVELDSALRLRQSVSTQTPSTTMLGSIVGAVSAIPGIGRLHPYQNETSVPDSNGVPGYCIAIVVDGGSATAIAQAIQQTKFGCGTYGTTTETVVDSVGVSHAINFFFTSEVEITWAVTLTPKATFSTNTIALIQASLASWTNSLGIGQGIQLSRAWSAGYLAPSISAAAANLQAAVAASDSAGIATYSAQLTSLNAASLTYELTALAVSRTGSPAPADVTIAFNEAAQIVVDASGNPVSSGSVTVTI